MQKHLLKGPSLPREDDQGSGKCGGSDNGESVMRNSAGQGEDMRVARVCQNLGKVEVGRGCSCKDRFNRLLVDGLR